MHDWLYAHTAAVIYKVAIASKKLTSEPSAFFRRLLTNPIIVNAPQASYELPSYSHFLDVSHGVEETEKSSSSFNHAEIEVVSSLVLSLLHRGVSKGEVKFHNVLRVSSEICPRTLTPADFLIHYRSAS